MIYRKICIEGENENTIIPRGRLVEIENGRPFIDCPFIDSTDKLSGKAIYLDKDFDWIIGKSETGSLVCVPLRKDIIRR